MEFMTSYKGIHCDDVILYCFKLYDKQTDNKELLREYCKNFLISLHSDVKKAPRRDGDKWSSITNRFRVISVSYLVFF